MQKTDIQMTFIPSFIFYFIFGFLDLPASYFTMKISLKSIKLQMEDSKEDTIHFIGINNHTSSCIKTPMAVIAFFFYYGAYFLL